MTDNPETKFAASGAWFVPEGAVSGDTSPTQTASVPLPTDAEPERPGGWYVPPEALARVSALLLESRSPQLELSAREVIPAAVAAGSVTSQAPPKDYGEEGVGVATLEEAAPQEPVQPEAEEADKTEDSEALPGGVTVSPTLDYSNYVPGVGFVSGSEAEAAVQRESEAEAILSQTPTSAESDTESVKISEYVDEEAAPVMADDKPEAAPPAAAHVPEPHHAPDVVAQAPTDGKALTAAGATEAQASQPAAALEPEPADPNKRFKEVEIAVQRLRRKYTAGGMTREQLKDELKSLMILDKDGNWWMIGLETDRWYRYNGSEWVLENPPGYTPDPLVSGAIVEGGKAPAGIESGSFPQSKFNIPTDEYGMPLPQRVPLEDEGGTVVGRWASRLATESSAGVAPYDGGVTVPHQPARPGQGGSPLDVTQPAGWHERLDNVPAGSQATVVSRPAGGAQPTIPAPTALTPQAPRSIQPDYGLAPAGLMANQQRYGSCLIRAAILSVFLVLGGTLLVSLFAVLGYFSIINRYTANIDNLANAIDAQSQSVKFYDVRGNELFQLNDPNLGARLQTTLDKVSPYMIHATIATENSRFYSDPGFDLVAMVRAILQNLSAGGTVSGASTITQQLARSKVLEPGAAADRSVGRKIAEVIVSSEIARRYSKSQIIEYYLNSVYYGNLAYGVEAAAQTYFGKSAQNLDLAEASFLAGLVQAPASYDPAINPTAAIERAKDVRRLMLELGCIQMEHAPFNTAPFCVTQDDMNAAVVLIAQTEARMATWRPPVSQVKYPHFINYVRQQLEDQFGQDALYAAGFNVYTTIDPRLQDLAEQTVKNQIAAVQNLRITNGAVMVTRPQDGAILVMVGSADFYNTNIDGQVNVAIRPRQAGSSLKPFVYLTAFERNAENNYWTPATIIWDVESCFGTGPAAYCPVNYNRRFNGPVPVRSALGSSLNVPAVKAMAYAGIDRFRALAERVGITFPLTPLEQAGLSAALGAAEVRMIDVIQAYGVLANNGMRVPLYAISKITRRKGGQEELVFEYKPPEPRQEVEPGLAYLITSILTDNNARLLGFNANNPLNIRGYRVAAKTGTSDNNRDNWTYGYAPNVVVGVWVGNTRGEPMSPQATGITGAAPIWNAVMTAALAGTPPQEFPVPPTVQQGVVCADFGTQDYPDCKTRRNEVFLASNPPPPADTVFRVLPIDTFTGLIANENCPDYVENRTFLVENDPTAINWLNNTPQGQEWARERNISLPVSSPPTQACQPGQPRPVVRITSPQPGQQISGLIQVQGAVSLPSFNRYQIEVGISHQPTAFGIVDGPITAQPPGDNAFLGRWDTTTVPDGAYTLKLWAVDNEGRFVQATVPVVVNNAAAPPVFPTQPPIIPGIPPTETPIGIPVVPPGFTPGSELLPTVPFTVPPTATSPFPDQPTPGGIQMFPPTITPSQ